MAWLGRLLTNWAPQRDLREFSVRFCAMTHVGERIVCTGRVADKLERDGERAAPHGRVATANEAGEVKLTGEALIAAASAMNAYRSRVGRRRARIVSRHRTPLRRATCSRRASRPGRRRIASTPNPGARWATMGLLLCAVPEEYGGSGGTFAHDCIVFEELGYAGVTSFGKQRAQHLRAIRRGRTAPTRRSERWLPRLATGELRRRDRDVGTRCRIGSAGHSHARAASGRPLRARAARRRSSSNGQVANLHAVSSSRPNAVRPRRRASRCVMVETDGLEGFRRGRTLDKIGMPGPGHVRALLRRLPGPGGRSCSAASKAPGSRR